MEIARINYLSFFFGVHFEQPAQEEQPQSQPPFPRSFLTICHTPTPTTNAAASTIKRISYHCIYCFSPLLAATSFSASAFSAAVTDADADFATGCFLFHHTIPAIAPAKTAAKMNTVHHRLPTR